MKRYVQEEGSAAVRRLLRHELRATVRATETEVASALARRCREGAFTQAELKGALATLREDMDTLAVIEVSPEVVAGSVALVQRHALRAGDALQLAAARVLVRHLRVEALFVAFDRRLLEAARAEGFKTAPG